MPKLAPLSKTEELLIPSILKILKTLEGKSNIKTNAEICEILFSETEISINDSRFRKIIRYIRVNNLLPFLASNSKGYYIENNKEEMFKFVIKLEETAETIRATALALRKQLIDG